MKRRGLEGDILRLAVLVEPRDKGVVELTRDSVRRKNSLLVSAAGTRLTV
jgi:hypothetical protein